MLPTPKRAEGDEWDYLKLGGICKMSFMQIKCGDFSLDTLRHVLTDPSGREAQLSPLASQLLQELAKRPGQTFERSELVQALWRGDWLVGDPALNRVVSEIRKIAGDNKKAPSLIQTVPRRGYRLVTEHAQAGVDGTIQLDRGLERLERLWRLALQTLLTIVGALVLLVGIALIARHLR